MATTYHSQSEKERQRLDELAHRAADPADPTTITYEEFLEWADEDTHAEWVDGKVELTGSANLRHQQIGGFLLRLISALVDAFDLGTVIMHPFQMKLLRSGRAPDLIFVAREREGRIQDVFVDGPADLVVEVVSPDSVKRDRETKLREYGQGGVGEYWLIDPRTHEARFYQRDAGGTFGEVMLDADGLYHSRMLPRFWLKVAWLWQDPLPNVERTLLVVAGDAYAHYLSEAIAAHISQDPSLR